MNLRKRMFSRWQRFWLWRGGHDRWGRIATYLGSLGCGSFKELHRLRLVAPDKGYIAPSAEIRGIDLRMGKHVFIGERVVMARLGGSALVELGFEVNVNRECIWELLEGGSISVGEATTIQPRCYFAAALEPIRIGAKVQIAPYCALYSFDHGIAPDQSPFDQPLSSKGPIVVEDHVWLGIGVTVLSNVRIGEGAVVGAGSVVTRDIPPGVIAAGVPARIVKQRSEVRRSAGQAAAAAYRTDG